LGTIKQKSLNMRAKISQGHLCTHESAMGRSRTSKLVSNNPYPFFKYHQNDKVAKTERLSIEGKKSVQLRYKSFFTLSLRYELIINDHTVVVRNMTKIKAMSLYFKLCRSGKLNRLSSAFTCISFLTIIVQLLWPTPQNVCPMSSVKSDSTHHFFGNACTKLGPLRFSQFSDC
jgi:hypothetical protein